MFDFDTPVSRSGTASLKWEKYANRDVLPLWVADMDFPSPPDVLHALHQRVDHAIFGYTVPSHDAVDAVLDYLSHRHRLAVDPSHLVWIPGLVPALNLCCRMAGDASSAIMTSIPVYPPFLSAPYFSHRKRITVPLACHNEQWSMDWDAMEAAVTPDTKLYILCHPHNPVGRVWTRDELLRLLDFCERHDLILVSDEIHCDLLLDDLPHIPTLSLGETAARRVVTLHAPSKTYNLPGLCCAYAVIPDDTLRAQFTRTARGIITEINAFGYAGCAAAYRHGEPWRQALLHYLRANRDLVYEFVRDHLPGVTMHPMSATYLAWLDVRPLGLEHPAAFFEQAGVGLSNGSDFGTPGFLRLNFGTQRATLKIALDRMATAIASL
ncbi:MAG TPA: PatB family C-S lyase [Kiritimatiellia bacterium]|nr:PatB family C-S lyase [Kiritimatiellia bacterium]